MLCIRPLNIPPVQQTPAKPFPEMLKTFFADAAGFVQRHIPPVIGGVFDAFPAEGAVGELRGVAVQLLAVNRVNGLAGRDSRPIQQPPITGSALSPTGREGVVWGCSAHLLSSTAMAAARRALLKTS